MKGNAIVDVKFDGVGCAIAMASADLMADTGKCQRSAVHGSTLQSMMKGEEPPKDTEAERYGGAAQFPVRIKCANLTWHTLKAALESPNNVQPDEFVSNEKKTPEFPCQQLLIFSITPSGSVLPR